MTIRFRFCDGSGNIVFCTLEEGEKELVPQLQSKSTILILQGKKIRGGVLDLGSAKLYAFSSKDDFIKSGKCFMTAINLASQATSSLQQIIVKCQEQANSSTNRLLHNLVTLNAHNIQEIYSVIPQDALAKMPAAQQVSLVEGIIKKDPKDAAFAFLRIAKNNAAMKAEFSVFKKLFEENPRLEQKSHNVHKVLLNILYLFFPDFTDKEVRVKISCPENTIAFFDYESIHVALYHLIENAVKYVKPNTVVDIDIYEINKKVTLSLAMTSLKISEKEKTAIFNEGYSGEIALALGKAGSGIGMSRVSKILEINNASISVSFDPSTIKEHFGVPYQQNIFAVNLPTSR
jgi:signal transduction histidine kinase